MPRKNARNTRSRIVSAAWELFYENGYDSTTVDDIVGNIGIVCMQCQYHKAQEAKKAQAEA